MTRGVAVPIGRSSPEKISKEYSLKTEFPADRVPPEFWTLLLYSHYENTSFIRVNTSFTPYIFFFDRCIRNMHTVVSIRTFKHRASIYSKSMVFGGRYAKRPIQTFMNQYRISMELMKVNPGQIRPRSSRRCVWTAIDARSAGPGKK